MNRDTVYQTVATILIVLFAITWAWSDALIVPDSFPEHVIAADGTSVDRHYLAHRAKDAGVSPRIVLAIAYAETRNNLTPTVRGRHGEVGRFQIKLTTAAERCAGVNVRTYKGNVDCFLEMFASDVRRLGTLRAIEHHNGRGPQARAYTQAVLATVGKWSVQ